MATYCVMLPPKTQGGAFSAPMAERARFIKDGISWPALVAPILWLLWHRMWLVFLAYIAGALALEGLSRAFGGPAVGVSSFLLGILFALEANNLRCWSLERRGWRFDAVSDGADMDEAELRYYHARAPISADAASSPMDASPLSAPIDALVQTSPRPTTRPSVRIGSEAVVGLTLARDEFSRPDMDQPDADNREPNRNG